METGISFEVALVGTRRACARLDVLAAAAWRCPRRPDERDPKAGNDRPTGVVSMGGTAVGVGVERRGESWSFLWRTVNSVGANSCSDRTATGVITYRWQLEWMVGSRRRTRTPDFPIGGTSVRL